MSKLTNATNVTASLSCDKKEFTCTIHMDGGSELYFNGLNGVDVFFNMIDMFVLDEDEGVTIQ